MEILLHDEDIVSMVLEFLHSKQLHETAVTLEKETGIIPIDEDCLSERAKYLRCHALKGDWDDVLSCLEQIGDLSDVVFRKLHFLILRQQYTEIMYFRKMSRDPTVGNNDALKRILVQIRPYCTGDDLAQMLGTENLLSSRYDCFKNILDILSSYFSSLRSPRMKEQVEDWVSSRQPENEFTRLESVVSDSLLLDECRRCCRVRALRQNVRSSGSYSDSIPHLSTKTIIERVPDIATNTGVLFWIRSLDNDRVFRHQYEIGDIQVKTKPVIKHDGASMQESLDSPKKFSSFLSSEQSPRASVSKHVSTRNLSNNNNKELSQEFNQEPSDTVPDAEPIQNGHHTTPEFSPLQPPVLNQDAPLQTSHPETSPDIPKWAQMSLKPSPLSVPTPSESPPRNLHNSHSAPEQAQQKVDASFQKFLDEKGRAKTEKDKFLKDLEEKERKNKEIRKLLQTNQTGSPDTTTWKDESFSPQSSPQNKTIEPKKELKASGRNVPSFSKSRYIPIEYTEDIQAIRTVSFHSGGQVYAVGSNNRTLRICTVPREVTSGSSSNIKSSQEVITQSPKPATVIAQKSGLHKGSVYCAAWNDEGSLIATGSNDKLIKLLGFDILGKTLDDSVHEIPLHRGIVREVSFLYESNNILASAGADNMVYITDCNHKTKIHNLAGHTDQVLALYSWNPQMLVSSSQDKSIRLWDVRTARCISIIGAGGERPCVATSVCVNASGQWLAMGLDNANVAIYDMRAGNVKKQFKCHTDEVRCVRFNPVTENILLSSSYDGSVVLTDVDGIITEGEKTQHNHWKRISESKNKLIQCKWHPNGEAFAATSVDKTCKLYMKFDT